MSRKSDISSSLVIITGASRGIGKALAQRFAEGGYDIFATARNQAGLLSLRDELITQYPKIKVYIAAADLSHKSQVENLGAQILGLQRNLRVLINNAGAFVSDTLLDSTDCLPAQIETNLYSAYYLTRRLLPSFLAQKDGYIFNICSVASLQAYSGGASYCISKYALRGFSHMLRQELQSHHIAVSTVLPGATLTDSWKSSPYPPERFIAAKDLAELIFCAHMLTPSSVVEEICIRPQLGDL